MANKGQKYILVFTMTVLLTEICVVETLGFLETSIPLQFSYTDEPLHHIKKRDAELLEYIVIVEVNVSQAVAIELIRSTLASIMFPLQVDNNGTEITEVNITTVCQPNATEYQCICEDGYAWSYNNCRTYEACNDNRFGSCGCINDMPADGEMCLLQSEQPTTDFLLEIEMDASVISMISEIRSLLENFTFPFKLDDLVEVIDLDITTVCNFNATGYQCRCEDEYIWPCDKCKEHGSCSATNDTCSCINTLIDGQFCQPVSEMTEDNATCAQPLTAQPSDYVVHFDVRFFDLFLVNNLRNLITNINMPLILSNNINVTDIDMTTVCGLNGTEYECECEEDHVWSSDTCDLHQVCDVIVGGTCGCIQGLPTEGQLCQRDINECKDTQSVCGPNSYCTNIIGSHMCSCWSGFTALNPDSPVNHNNPCVLIQPSSEYEIEIQINILNSVIIDQLRTLLMYFSLPYTINHHTNITEINMTTVCLLNEMKYQCKCEGLFVWSNDTCHSHETCDNITDDACTCISDLPNNGQFCQLKRGPTSDFIIDVDVRFFDSFLVNYLRYLLTNINLPLTLSNSINVTDIDVTTVCGLNGTEYECECEEDHVWSSDTCDLHQVCDVIVGGTCGCIQGLPTEGQLCQRDINECKDTQSVCGPNSHCTNIIGSHMCSCWSGFTALNPDSPVNHNNPCVLIQPSSEYEIEIQINTLNSVIIDQLRTLLMYFSLPYTINHHTNITEINMTTVCGLNGTEYECECEEHHVWSSDTCDVHQVCDVIVGGTCGCIQGLPSEGQLCQRDINECKDTQSVCGPNSHCTNIIGSHMCSCWSGFTALNPDSPVNHNNPCVLIQLSSEYEIEIQINILNSVIIDQLRTLLMYFSLPYTINHHTNITEINMTTVCLLNEMKYQCKCEGLFVWSNDTCHSHETCDNITDDACTCISDLPNNGQFCQLKRGPSSNYTIDVDVRFFDLFLVNYLRNLLTNINLLLTLSNSINVTDIDMTTVCGLNGTEYECECEEDHVWSSDTCDVHQVCDVIVGGTCGCIQGLPSEGQLCQRDINECKDTQSVCGPNSHCTNIIGSHMCSCWSGFTALNPDNPVNHNNPCVLIQPSSEYEIEIQINILNSVIIGQLRTLLMYFSLPYTINHHTNITEINMTTVCGLNGTEYECECEEHHVWSSDTCDLHQVCDVIVGGTCGCIQGLPSEGQLCQRDINECKDTQSVCGPNSHCTNIIGSHMCSCWSGFTALNPDSPVNHNNPCVLIQPSSEYEIEIQINTLNSVIIGQLRTLLMYFSLPYTINHHTNITEINMTTVCLLNEMKYQCKCEGLFVWSNDTCHSHETCDNITDDACTCISDLPNNGQFCQLKRGPTSDFIIDVDVRFFDSFLVNYLRYLLTNINLPLTLSNSINVTDIDVTTVCGLNGTEYECECEEDHVWSSDTCDVHQVCDVIVGGTCGCIQGLPSEGQLCQRDINECKDTQSVCGPNSYCTNIIGSHMCSCWSGFTALNPDNPVNHNNPCVLIQPSSEYEIEIQINILNSVIIGQLRTLLMYFSLPYTINHHTNITEINMTTVCGLNGTEYECECEEHHVWSSDTCDLHQVCDVIVGGTCGCIQGLPSEGQLCQRDINECKDTQSVCGPNSHCTNIIGSHMCSCWSGFTALNPDSPVNNNNPCVLIQPSSEYEIEIQINILNSVIIGQLRTLLMYFSLPYTINHHTNITEINMTTVCLLNEMKYQCKCEGLFVWSNDTCHSHETCDNITDDACTCISDLPNNGQFCQLKRGPSSNYTIDVDVRFFDWFLVNYLRNLLTNINLPLTLSNSINVTDIDMTTVCVLNGTEYECECEEDHVWSSDTCDLHQVCDVIVGGTCGCIQGLPSEGQLCQRDINECKDTQPVCGPNSHCTNIIGSHMCSCWSGFTALNPDSPVSSNNSCDDVDECDETPEICGPNSICNNTAGHYDCWCMDGYNVTDPNLPINISNPCTDMFKCVDPTSFCGPNADCHSDNGSFSCSCWKGYDVIDKHQRISHRNPCADVDECNEIPEICGPNSICNNTAGHYDCWCMDGYILTDSNLPVNISNPCTVIQPSSEYEIEIQINTLNSVIIDQLRTLLMYFSLPYTINHHTNITEINMTTVCLLNEMKYQCKCEGLFVWSNDTCHSHETCDNITDDACTCISDLPNNGQFCQLKRGPSSNYTIDVDVRFFDLFLVNYLRNLLTNINLPLTLSNSINVTDIDMTTVCGLNGTEYECECEEDHVWSSDTCDLHQVCDVIVGGTCGCIQGLPLEGQLCQRDINECKDTQSVCGPNSHCTNIIGSHMCSCWSGFTALNPDSPVGSNNSCDDVDECDGTPDICGPNSICNNTAGHYDCWCMDGYNAIDPKLPIDINNSCTESSTTTTMTKVTIPTTNTVSPPPTTITTTNTVTPQPTTATVTPPTANTATTTETPPPETTATTTETPPPATSIMTTETPPPATSIMTTETPPPATTIMTTETPATTIMTTQTPPPATTIMTTETPATTIMTTQTPPPATTMMTTETPPPATTIMTTETPATTIMTTETPPPATTIMTTETPTTTTTTTETPATTIMTTQTPATTIMTTQTPPPATTIMTTETPATTIMTTQTPPPATTIMTTETPPPATTIMTTETPPLATTIMTTETPPPATTIMTTETPTTTTTTTVTPPPTTTATVTPPPTSAAMTTVTPPPTITTMTLKSPPTTSVIPPTTALIPPTTALIPPTTTVIPPTTAVIPPTTAVIPPTTTVIPPTTTVIPPTTTVIPPTTALIPPTTALIPPTTTVIPPTTAVIPPTTAVIPPTTAVIPPTTALIPPTTTVIPPTTALIPPTTALIPPTTALIPPTTTVIPPTTALIPPTTALIPPTTTVIPPTTALIPPTTALIPPTTALIPPTTTVIPPTTAVIPPTTAVLPPTTAAIPPTTAVIPPTTAVIPPTTTVLPPTTAAIPPMTPVKPTPTVKPPPTAKVIKMTMRINQKFDTSLTSGTQLYLSYVDKIVSAIEKSYKSLPNYNQGSVKVTGFRPGSIIADYTITAKDNNLDFTSANELLSSALLEEGIELTSDAFAESEEAKLTENTIYPQQNVELRCTLPGSVEGEIKWTVNEKYTIENNMKYTIENNNYGSTLTVKNTDERDSGRYACILGRSTLPYIQWQNIAIEPRPNIIVDKTDIKLLCEDQTVSLTCCEDKYLIEWLGFSDPDTVISKGSNCITLQHKISSSSCKPEQIFTCQLKDKTALETFDYYKSTATVQIVTTDLQLYVCKSETLGVGKIGEFATGLCEEGLEGIITYQCQQVNSINDWKETERDCVVKAIKNLQRKAEVLTDVGIPDFLAELNSTAVNHNDEITSSANTVRTIVDILLKVATISKNISIGERVMENFLGTVDVIVADKSINTWAELKKDNRTENKNVELLQAIENISEYLSTESFNINTPSIQLNKTKDTFTGTSLLPNSTTQVIIPNAKETSITIIIFTKLNNVLPTRNTSHNDSGKYNYINGDVVVVKVNESINNISFTFDLTNTLLKNPQCVYWNFSLNHWDSSGCKVKLSGNEAVTCECDHTTSFSILMSPFAPDHPALAYITYIGVAISMASLVLCLIIEMIVWKLITRNDLSYMRHVSIVNIAVSLLIANICFFIAAAIVKQGESTPVNPCSAAVFFMHFFYLALFFWMFISALLLFYHTVRVFSQLSKTNMMVIAFTVGYIAPLLIAVITVASTAGPKNYVSEKDACWLNWKESKALLAFVIPALTIVFFNLLVLIVVVCKMLRRGVGATTQPDERHTLMVIVRCVAFLTPIFGLTWGFGIGIMVSPNLGIHIVFAILNSLQGLFVLLFGLLFDSKIREALAGRLPFRALTSSNRTRSTFAGPSSNRFDFLRRIRRKNMYNVSEAAALSGITSNSSGASESYMSSAVA